MTSSSLFEECQGLIERGHEYWKSYFNKWEVFAKYEEDIPENYFVEKSDVDFKPPGKKKKKIIPKNKKRKTQSLITHKKNQKNRKKVFKKKQVTVKSIAYKNSKCNTNSSNENEDKNTENDIMEINLRTFFRNFLRENQNKLEIFGVLSLAFSYNPESSFHNLFSNRQQVLPYDFQSNKKVVSCKTQQTIFSEIPNVIVSNRIVSPVRSTYNEYVSGSINSPESHFQPVIEVRKLSRIHNNAVVDRYSRFEFSIKNNLSQSNTDPESKITPQRHLCKSSSLLHLRNQSLENLKLKPLDWDFSQKSPISLCEKINKEYFIKRTFPKMNITQDRKRFRNLCLHKRTNSVSLSMENSNFTTPERKPPERKCFSENILQRKRRCPSKLFLDNEEDSESDDQTENQAPVIHCQNKKLKTQIMTEVFESDSDEYESIFDRV